MDKLSVKKADLVAILKANKEAHAKFYNDALGGFKMTIEKELKKRLYLLRKEGKIHLAFYEFREPESHVKEYEDAIGMLEICLEENIEIDMEEYLKYYKNEWSWSASWKSSNTGYATLYNVAGVGAAKPKSKK